MVNDYLIIDTSLVRNNNKQGHAGGGMSYTQNTATSSMMVTRVAMVYLPSGVYTFNVGVRCGLAPGSISGGLVIYELTQFSDGYQDLDDIKLAKFSK